MRNLAYLCFFIVVSLQAQTKMTLAEATALKETVKSQATTTKTITSDFVQNKHLDFLSNDIITKGSLAFKVPNMIKWEYVDPFKYSVVFKNDMLYINDEGNKSDIDLGSNKMFKQLNTLIIKSVKGDMFDENEFDIEYYNKDNNSLVYFSPKDKKFAKYIKAFHITFNKKGDVIALKMIEPSGDYTKITFTNKILNSPLDDALFTN